MIKAQLLKTSPSNLLGLLQHKRNNSKNNKAQNNKSISWGY